jgi:hypothetical protein
MGARYPRQFEVDDALDTAKAMGARVIRSQTLGDSIGYDLCIEPKLGQFNPEAFAHIDYALKAAHDRGLRLIITLVGDCVCTIERQDSASAPWVVLTDSATDADTPWVDPNPVAGGLSGTYRVTAYNADGIASQPSAPR